MSRKPRLGDFGDGMTTRLAKAGHRAMRQHIAIREAFPLPIEKEELSWRCLLKAADGNQEMMAELKALEDDSLIKCRLIDYVSTSLFIV